MRAPTSVCKLLALWILIFAAALPLSAEVRLFTNEDGGQLRGKIVSATETAVQIKRDWDLKTFTIKRSDLCEADQRYVDQWLKEKTDRQLYLEVRQTQFGRDVIKRSKVEKKKKKERGVQTKLITLRRFTEYDIIIENRGGNPVKDLRVESQLVRQISRSGLRRHRDYVVGKKTDKISELESRGETQLVFNSDDYLADTKDAEAKKVPIKGLLVDLYVGDTLVRSVSFPAGLAAEMKRAKRFQEIQEADEAKRAANTEDV